MKTLVFFLLLVSGGANASEWFVDVLKDKSGVFAATSNQDGEIISLICPDGPESRCFWTLLLTKACAQTKSFPVLANGPSSASGLNLTCDSVSRSSSTLYRYIVQEYEIFDGMVKEGGIMGIAFPLQSGKFQVSRFDTSGAGPNIDKMMRMSIERDKKSTKGTTL